MPTSAPNGGGAQSLAALLAASGTGFDSDPHNYSILQAALAATGLDAALDDPDAHLTLLAPTDAAFLHLARSLGYEGEDEEAAFTAIAGALASLAPDGDPIPLLADVLRYHVLGGAFTEEEVIRAESIDTLLADTPLSAFGRRLPDADPDARDARLIPSAGESAANGVLLPIDAVRLPADLPTLAKAEAPPPSLAAILAASGTGFDDDLSDFDVLREAVEAAGLTGVLADPMADLTVLAPNDAAFLELARQLGYAGGGEQGAAEAVLAALTTLGDGDPVPLLTGILLGHVVEGRVSVQQAEAAGSLETLGGTTLAVDGRTLADSDPDLRDARFVPGETNTLAANGALQAIDRVLLPFDLDTAGPPSAATLADELAASGTGFDDNARDFDMLNAALEAAGLTGALADRDAHLTLFAPTDAAFIDLARALGYEGRDEAEAFGAIVDALTAAGGGDPIPLLTEILLTHVAPVALTAEEIRASASVETLGGFALTPFGRLLGDGDPTLPDPGLIGRRTDLEAANGLLQAIDGVLLPFDLPEGTGSLPPAPTLAGLIADLSGEPGFDDDAQDFDMLRAALEAADLTAALEDPDAHLTLLAPTDAAFIGLAQALGYEGEDEAGAFGAIVAALTDLGGGDPIPVLTEVLLTHVVEGTFSRDALQEAGEVEALSGFGLTIRGRCILDAEPALDAQFIRGGGDIAAANGALQAIDGVLLPVDLPLM